MYICLIRYDDDGDDEAFQEEEDDDDEENKSRLVNIFVFLLFLMIRYIPYSPSKVPCTWHKNPTFPFLTTFHLLEFSKKGSRKQTL